MENLKKQEAFFQKCLHLELENVTNFLFALPLFPTGHLQKRNLLPNSQTLTTHEQPPLRDLSSLLAEQVCVVPLDSSFMFCGCSLTYAATKSWCPSRQLTMPTSVFVTLKQLKIQGNVLVSAWLCTVEIVIIHSVLNGSHFQ